MKSALLGTQDQYTSTHGIEDGLVTVTEASAFLKLARSTLYELMDAGRLPHCKIGRARRIPKAALIALALSTLRGNL